MVIRLIFGVQLALILLGLAEIATGWHMPVSAFHDPASALAKLENRHLATGLMYNANDFSALITCLCAVLPDKSIGKGKYLSLAGVVFINLVNDANICNISLFLLAAFYLFCWRSLSGRPMNKRIIAFSSLLLFAALVIFSGRIRNMVFRVFSEQIGNAQKGTGSLFSRLEIYKDTILAWGRHALLGMGPASFTPYFTAHPSRAGIVNPHGLPLEILFQYGILIFSAFMGLLASLFIRAKRAYDSLKSGALKHILLMNMAFAVLFLINSFVPSSFLGYTYPWMLISVMCIQQDKHAEWEEE